MAAIERSCNCPQCGRPDLVVVERPNIVKCLVCGCVYQYDDLAGGARRARVLRRKVDRECAVERRRTSRKHASETRLAASPDN